MKFSEDEFIELAGNAVRRVQTPEGAKKFGQPIGTIITADMLKRANKGNKSSGSASVKGEDGSDSSVSTKGGSPSSAKSKKLSPEDNYGSSKKKNSSSQGGNESESNIGGVKLKDSTLSGPNTFKVGDSNFSAPTGSKLVRPKNNDSMAYVLTSNGDVHAFNQSGEVEVPDYLAPVLQEKFSNLGADDPLYSIEEFDVKSSISLKDQKQGAVLTVDGEPSFTKTGEDTWEHSYLGVTLTDEDLQPQFDAGKFSLQTSEASSDTDFSKMTAGEIEAVLDSYDVGKELLFGDSNPATLVKLENGNWKNVKFNNDGISSASLAGLADGTNFLSEKTDVPDDAPETLQDPLSRETSGKSRDQRLFDEANLDLIDADKIAKSEQGAIVFHGKKGMLVKQEDGTWEAEDGTSYDGSEMMASAGYNSLSNLPWNSEQQDSYDSYQADKLSEEEEQDSSAFDEDTDEEVTVPSNATQVQSLDGFVPGDEIYISMDHLGNMKLELQDDGTWLSNEGDIFEPDQVSMDLESGDVWSVPKAPQVDEIAKIKNTDKWLDTAKSLKTSEMKKSHHSLGEVESLEELENLEPGSIITVSEGTNSLSYVKDNEGNFIAGDGHLFSFEASEFSGDIEDPSLHLEIWEKNTEDDSVEETTPISPPSEEDEASSGLSNSDKKSAIQALESHSGFQIKYGLKSLPDTHPLKNEDTLKAEIDAAKDAYPTLAPKQALLAYLKGESPLEPLADWEKDLLESDTVQIGSENPKKVVQGVTGGVFTQKEIQDAINILENYKGKIFKSELVKNGSPLGALSPNDIIGFEKDKLVGKQKFIDFLKGKLSKFDKKAPKKSKKYSHGEAIQSYDDFLKLPIGAQVDDNVDTIYTKVDENHWTSPDLNFEGDELDWDDTEFQKAISSGILTFHDPQESEAPKTIDEAISLDDFEFASATLEQVQGLPTGTKLYYKSSDSQVLQTWEKTGNNEWTNVLDGNSYHFQNKDMLVSFNKDNGWSKETAVKDVSEERIESQKPAFYPLDAGSPVTTVAQAEALPVGSSLMNEEDGYTWTKKNNGLWESESGTISSDSMKPWLHSGNAVLKSLGTEEELEELENGHALISDPDNAVKVGGQAGSNPGGLYNLATSDGTFKKFYVKKAQTEDHGKNEALANALYKELGVNVPNVDFSSDGNLYSEIVDGDQNMQAQLDYKNESWMKKVQKDFAIDAWLSNRDVFGLTYDNILTDGKGDPWRIDNGGALKYRAMGEEKKDFGSNVTELDVFKTGKKSLVFGSGVMSKEEELDGAKRLAKLSPERIDELVSQYGMDSDMAEILKERRKYVLDYYKLDDPFGGTDNESEIVHGAHVKSGQIDGLPDGTNIGFQSSPELEKPNFYIEKVDGKWINAEATVDFTTEDMKAYADKGYLTYDFIPEDDNAPGVTPEVTSPHGIAPGKYNSGKGAKAHLYVKSDGTGVYAGMKGVLKPLDAEGVKKNYDLGMNNLVQTITDDEVPGESSTTSTSKKVIPTLGSIDTLPDGVYDGPLGVKYTVKGDEVTASKAIKSMDFSTIKVGQIPNKEFADNAPVGTKLSFQYLKDWDKSYVTKNEDGEWKGDEQAENYLSHLYSEYAWKHKSWKVDSFPGSNDSKVTKASLKSKYLQGQLLDPETNSSIFPPGYSGSVTFFGGATDIAALTNWKNYLQDPDIPIGEKGNAHQSMGVPLNAQFLKNYVNKKHGVEESSGQQQLDFIIEELDNYLSTASVPEGKDFSTVFEYDEFDSVVKPLEVAALPQPNYYSSTGEFSEYIKKVSQSFGDGKLIGVNMAGAKKSDKESWVSYFQKGDLAALYKIELQVATAKKKQHPTGTDHPGHPQNTSTHKITWGAAVKGEVPAGKEVLGNWTSIGIDASLEEIDNYLILAKMQNPTHLSVAEKRSWVLWHRQGNKSAVDDYSAKAALRAKNNEPELTPAPQWTDDIKPSKSYDSLFDDTEFPQTWLDYPNMHKKSDDFYADYSDKEPELVKLFEQFNNEDPYGYPAAKAIQAFFAAKEQAYLEELAKPIWEVKKSISEGSHPTFIVKDQKSEKMKIFKPLTPGKEWRAENEAAAHKLGSLLGFNVPGATIGEVDEGVPTGINNKGIVMDFAPNVGSLGNVDGAPVDLKTLTAEQFGQLAREHVFDWFLDNDDTHDENILIGTDGKIVAIDKGRAFVQYGHWHGLDVDNPESLNVNTKDSPGRKNVVYANMIKAIKKGEISQEQLDEAYKQAMRAAKRVQKSDDNTISAFVKSATDQRTDWSLPSYAQNWEFMTPHPENQEDLIKYVLLRKNSMVEDFEEFYDKLYKAAGYFKPEPPAKILGENHLSGWEESDLAIKTEEAKVWGAAPIHASAGFKDGASLLWTEKDTDGNSVVSGKFQLGNLTQQKVMDFMASKLSPHTGVQATSSLKDYPTSHVKTWKKTVTAVGKDLTANATTGAYNEALWDEMKQVEEKVNTDLSFAETVDTYETGTVSFPSGVTMPNETVPQYVMALNYHKALIANVEKAKAAKETTDKTHFQDFVPPEWKIKGIKYLSPEGVSYKELDNGNFVSVNNGVATIVPDVPEAAKNGAPGWTVELPEGGVQEQTAEKYTLINAGMFSGQLNDNGEKILKSDFSTSGHPGKEYRIDLPTGEKIFFRDGGQTQTVRSQTGTVRFQLNKSLDTETSLANVQAYLETTGLDMSGADEEQAETLYWRQMFNRVIFSDTSKAPAGVKKVKDELLGMKSQLAQKLNVSSISDFDIVEAIGLTEEDEHSFWDKRAREAFGDALVSQFLADGEHLPKYQHMDLNDPEKATGLPWYKRIDVQLDALRAKGALIAHGNNGKDKRHFDYIKSGAYTSTEERLRILGHYKEGASSSSDQGHGSASYVFTRIAAGSSLKKGSIYGSHVMYWSPDVMAMTGTYSLDSDQFGELNNQQHGTPYNPVETLGKFHSGGNETMVPNNISLLDFMELMVFDDENERLKAIAEFKKKGIDMLRGLPIEDRLVLRSKLDDALAKIKKAWSK